VDGGGIELELFNFKVIAIMTQLTSYETKRGINKQFRSFEEK